MLLCAGELYVIVEYCHFGNLRNYVLKHKDEFEDTMDDDYLDPITKKMREAGETEAEEPTASGVSGSSGSDEPRAAGPAGKSKHYYVNKAPPDHTGALVGPPLTRKNMMSWSFQVARGMEYLASKKVRVWYQTVTSNNDQCSSLGEPPIWYFVIL